jgi:signal transduction histidine kinase
VARCELIWHMETDTDVLLTMVQWSALTRILRELVSNAISHAKANQVDIQLTLLQDQLTLSVSDNGRGRDPARWSHGLGLGGVRKRVKQLGGSVRWVEIKPQGICCEVVVASFSGSANTHQTSGAEAGSDSQFSH